MTDDLHARLTAEIQRRQTIVQAAADRSPTPWQYQPISLYMDGTSSGPIRHANGGPQIASAHLNVGPYIELHDPADALRRYTHYRRILERHERPDSVDRHDLPPYPCIACSRPGDWIDWPCQEIRDLADALNIPHTQDQP